MRLHKLAKELREANRRVMANISMAEKVKEESI
jgi:hypothetical protein